MKATTTSPLLDPYNLGTLHNLAKITLFSPSQVVIKEGALNQHLIVLFSGRLQSGSIEHVRRKIILESFEPGSVICDFGALIGQPAAVNIYAVTTSTIGTIKVSQSFKEVATIPNLAEQLIRQLCFRSNCLSAKAINFAANDVPSRLLNALKQISAPSHFADGSWIVNERPTHEELAEIVGSSREVISRAFKLLRQSGEIEIRGRQVVVKHPEV